MSSIPRDVSCADDFDPNAVSVDQALARIDDWVQPIRGIERVAVRAALGRVLAEPVVSPVAVPAHTNSAMDGYAVNSADLPASGEVRLHIVGQAFAGAPFADVVAPGQAVRIMTGGVLPTGTDCVVMQEHVARDGDYLRVGTGHKAWQNIRHAGEDIAVGQTVLEPGRVLTPSDLGLIASLGQAEVSVVRRLRVAFFSTGDELKSLGEPLSPGDVYDSNRYTLWGMLTRLGCDLMDMGVVRDDPEALKAAFETAAASADVVITSGGVSVGEADFTHRILDELGEVHFWKIAMKPGRPLAFGRVGEALFFGLPGNPVSVMVTFYEFVQPALGRLAGRTRGIMPVFQVPCLDRLRKRPGRREYQRGILERQADGTLAVRGTGDQGSGILSTMSRANCLIILSEDSTGVDAGALVQVQPFDGLI